MKCTLAIRCHHLLKTFYNRAGGWADRQHPDGIVEWRSPSGKVYTTKPGGALFFPALAAPTGEIVLAPRRGRVCTDPD